MLGIDGREIARIEIKDKNGVLRVISYVRYYADLVWQAVRSCFGSGFWVNEKPWINSDPWNNI